MIFLLLMSWIRIQNLTKNTKSLKNMWSRPGSNWGPSACKADVITTTPQDHLILDSEIFIIWLNIIYHSLLMTKHPSVEAQPQSSWCCQSATKFQTVAKPLLLNSKDHMKEKIIKHLLEQFSGTWWQFDPEMLNIWDRSLNMVLRF